MSSKEWPSIHLGKGEEIGIVLEGDGLPVIHISHPAGVTPFKLDLRSIHLGRESQREQLKAKYPLILLSHIVSRLDRDGVIEKEKKADADPAVEDTEDPLKVWIEAAKSSGISNQEIIEVTERILKKYVGKVNPFVETMRVEISGLVNEVWGVTQTKESSEKPDTQI